jgi:hypothetical protein
MTRYRATYSGRITRTFVNRTAADALHELWSGYRYCMVPSKIVIEEKTLTGTDLMPFAKATFDVVFTKDVEASSVKDAILDFVSTGQMENIITLGFDPYEISIEEVKE